MRRKRRASVWLMPSAARKKNRTNAIALFALSDGQIIEL